MVAAALLGVRLATAATTHPEIIVRCSNQGATKVPLIK
jgi:hypothetical protein